MSCHANDWGKNAWPQLSQLAEPLWTDLCFRSGVGVHDLHFIKKKKLGTGGVSIKTFPPKSMYMRVKTEATTTTTNKINVDFIDVSTGFVLR